jgi:hypothetical protein
MLSTQVENSLQMGSAVAQAERAVGALPALFEGGIRWRYITNIHAAITTID